MFGSTFFIKLINYFSVKPLIRYLYNTYANKHYCCAIAAKYKKRCAKLSASPLYYKIKISFEYVWQLFFMNLINFFSKYLLGTYIILMQIRLFWPYLQLPTSQPKARSSRLKQLIRNYNIWLVQWLSDRHLRCVSRVRFPHGINICLTYR